jgi:hypothetical protein
MGSDRVDSPDITVTESTLILTGPFEKLVPIAFHGFPILRMLYMNIVPNPKMSLWN